MYHLLGIEKVPEQHIFAKALTHFGAIRNLLTVANSTIYQLAMDLYLQKQKQYRGHYPLS